MASFSSALTSLKCSPATRNAVKPVKVFRLRGIAASVFANQTQVDGQTVSYHKVTIQRTYRDGDEYKTTTSFSRDDLPIVSLLVSRAWEFVLDTESTHGAE